MAGNPLSLQCSPPIRRVVPLYCVEERSRASCGSTVFGMYLRTGHHLICCYTGPATLGCDNACQTATQRRRQRRDRAYDRQRPHRPGVAVEVARGPRQAPVGEQPATLPVARLRATRSGRRKNASPGVACAEVCKLAASQQTILSLFERERVRAAGANGARAYVIPAQAGIQ